ncbi:MAG TPA: 30S ribosomal protein S16, partial [Bacteroidota bacterium]|nr:30S ribosomal protein S16 [Bacteroidota bacterium]
MVRLRLWRGGKKKQPIYRIVAADSRAARNGKYIEAIGQYNPGEHPVVIVVQEDRLFHWLKRGAQPSDTVRSLLQRKGLWLRWGLMKKGADEETIAAGFERWQGMQEDKLRREVERKARRKTARKKKAAAEGAPAAFAPAAAHAPDAESAVEAAPAAAAEAAPAVAAG